ncbi:MAG TPA: YetF domain-containing protein [Acidimicrobiales bacterium]|nr:YetF domain-containing protein [Acidimicrobiales bacterium]
MELLGIVGRTVAVYAAVLVGLRIGGRRELGQLTPFDLVVILLVANAVQNAMVGSDTTLQGGLVAAATLLILNAVVARARLYSPRVRELVEGVPVVLVQEGRVIEANLKKEGITEEELLAAVREHGSVDELSHVAMAVLEADGSVSVVPMSADVQRSRRRLRHRRK